MKDLKTSQHAALADFHDKTEQMLAKLENPTQESVEKVFNSMRSADSDTLMSYTGYYSMDAAPGSFLSIDTVESYYKLSQKITISTSAVTISVSMNGTTSKTYPFGQGSTFDGKTLTIPNVLKITLTRQYNNGTLVTFSGVINNVNVTGSTQFNPIKLSTFNGHYYTVTTSGIKKMLSVDRSATNPYSSTIAFDFGSGMQEVRFYTFTPLMFVLMFYNRGSQDKEKYVLMLGTAGSMGLACFIQHGPSGEYAVTIPPAP